MRLGVRRLASNQSDRANRQINQGRTCVDCRWDRTIHDPIIVFSGEDVARAASKQSTLRRKVTTMLTPGERRFRGRLDTFIVLLVAITALVLVLEQAPDAGPQPVSPRRTISSQR